MIPTYLLTDSEANKKCIPEKLGIMGCRTRVYNNINGPETSIGRGNIANISINLPRISLEAADVKDFFAKLENIMYKTSQLLILRANTMNSRDNNYLQYTFNHKIWTSVNNIEDMLKQGTLSIGFIGLSETVEVLTGKKYFDSQEAYDLGLQIIRFMREYTDKLRVQYKANFSLLATAGEMISGRFCQIDKKIYNAKIQQKGFYANSFHVPVDSSVSLFKKINLEAPFHKLCNGGCITYVEFHSAPLSNTLALEDAIHYAEKQGVSYLEFNYPLDICNNCGNIGTFDLCTKCGSDNIKRIRRVSGYLEDLSYFTDGKIAEEKNRKANI
jgi:ribonucleoside-triphosphate reductase